MGCIYMRRLRLENRTQDPRVFTQEITVGMGENRVVMIYGMISTDGTQRDTVYE